jgi:hypothetical protein
MWLYPVERVLVTLTAHMGCYSTVVGVKWLVTDGCVTVATAIVTGYQGSCI